MLYVRDRGRGFDPDERPRDRQGIAQSIRARMARFGGAAVIRSSPGEGTEVQLSMPRRERVVTVTRAGRPGRRIFLVEDHAVFRAGVRAELGDAVEVVGEADEAGAAVELINERLPDVVLLDVHLPGGGGQAVLRGVLPAPPRGAVPRPLGLRRPRGRDRRHPGRRPRATSPRRSRGRSCCRPSTGSPPATPSSRPVWPGSSSTPSPRAVAPATGLDPELDQLSPREREVLRLIARGYTYKEVARDLTHLGQDGRVPRLVGPAQAAALDPPRVDQVGHRPALGLEQGGMPEDLAAEHRDAAAAGRHGRVGP